MQRLTLYVQQVIQESKKVTWPTRKQTQTMTLVVIVVSIGVGLYIGVLDYIFSRLVTAII